MFRSIKFASVLLILPLFFLFVLSGCKDDGKNAPVVYVEGVVSMGGKPVESAKVTFTPIGTGEHEAAWGETDLTGKFKLTSINGREGKGAVPGTYAVTITKNIMGKPVNPLRFIDSTGSEQFFHEYPVNLLPTKYSVFLKTPFRPIEIEKSKPNSYTFDIVSDGTEGVMLFEGKKIDYTK